MWVILGAVAVIAVVAAALGVVNTMLMAVSEQRYVIGVWRACGARKSTIVRLFLVESGLLGFIGGAIGVGLGVFVSGFVNEYVNSLLQSQGLALTNIAIVPPWLMGGTIILTTVFGVLAGIYPAHRAARQDPAEALTS
jgi:putative ABC transport system permease protein